MFEAVEIVGYALLKGGDCCVRLVGVEAEYALHFYFEKPQYVVACNVAYERRFERLQTAVDMRHSFVEVSGLLIFLVFIDAVFDKYLFKGGVEQFFAVFAENHAYVCVDYPFCGVHAVAKYVAHAEEARFLVLDYAAVGRYAHFAVGEGIERVYCLVA